MLGVGALDVLELAVIPIILGDGIPLFPSGTIEQKLRLVSCKVRATDALHLVYERADKAGREAALRLDDP